MTGQERDAAKRTPVMRWLRLYHEARTDAKLESLPDDEFRVWFRLLCFANEQPERGVIAHCSPRLLAVQVAHGDIALLQRTLANLTELQIVEASDDACQFLHWSQRQFPSDNVSERVMKHREESRQANETLQKHRSNVAVTAPDVDAEEDAEPEGEIQPPPSVVGEDRRQRQQRARAQTHEEPPPADAHPGEAAPQADVVASDAAMRASPGTPRQERLLSDEEFLRQFADAADLPASARGQALDAIIAEYRPRAPDGVLIVEAYSFREFYPKRPRNNRLLANWMATWWTRRQATIAATAAQPSTREEAQRGQRQHQQQSAAASSRYRGAGRRFDPPDPTCNGAYAHRIRDSSDFPDDDG